MYRIPITNLNLLIKFKPKLNHVGCSQDRPKIKIKPNFTFTLEYFSALHYCNFWQFLLLFNQLFALLSSFEVFHTTWPLWLWSLDAFTTSPVHQFTCLNNIQPCIIANGSNEGISYFTNLIGSYQPFLQWFSRNRHTHFPEEEEEEAALSTVERDTREIEELDQIYMRWQTCN